MEGRQVDQRKITWAAALALTGVILILSGLSQPPARAGVLKRSGVEALVCTVVCDTCSPQTYECHDDGQGGIIVTPPGSGGGPTEVPPGGGGTPQATAHPWPTIPPPTYAPPGGFYGTFCGSNNACPMGFSIWTYYQTPGGLRIITNIACTSTCTPATVTPPTPGPPTPPPYPCNTPPQPGGGTLTQPCASQWPGYNLSVSVKIPPVNMARNPWPRSLVGLETQLCFSSAPNDEEKFSAAKAVPCNAGGESAQATWQCGGSTGEVGEGARVNYQLGVAWRRYTGSDPGFGTTPPFRSALTLDDRDWNGGSQLIPLDPGQCASKTYETSSFGLDKTGEAWNPACQDRDCAYPERTLAVQRSCEACAACTCAGCAPAYDAFIQTWWWPEWTWRYDEYVCVHEETSCEPDPTGQHSCAGQPNMRTVRTCDRWGWRNVIEPWNLYDVRRQGLPLPYLGSGLTNAAGMSPDRQVLTPFQYSPSVPVIEIQPVHP